MQNPVDAASGAVTQDMCGADTEVLAVRESGKVLKEQSIPSVTPTEMLKQAEGKRSYNDKEGWNSFLGEVKKPRNNKPEGSDSDESLARC